MQKLPTFIKKPLEVEAIQFKGVYPEDQQLIKRLSEGKHLYKTLGVSMIHVYNLNGWTTVHPGDYVVFDNLEVYPVKPEYFEKHYVATNPDIRAEAA